MRTTSLALLDGHQHVLPDRSKLAAVLDHTDTRVPAERTTDLTPICLALAAVEDRCTPCQHGVSCWIARHGDPWTVVRLVGPVAADASQLAMHHARLSGQHFRVRARDLVDFAFGPDVARVVAAVGGAHDLAPAAKLIESFAPARRYELVRGILDAITQRAVVAALLFRLTRGRRDPSRGKTA